jgi:hypothetical protein
MSFPFSAWCGLRQMTRSRQFSFTLQVKVSVLLDKQRLTLSELRFIETINNYNGIKEVVTLRDFASRKDSLTRIN